MTFLSVAGKKETYVPIQYCLDNNILVTTQLQLIRYVRLPKPPFPAFTPLAHSLYNWFNNLKLQHLTQTMASFNTIKPNKLTILIICILASLLPVHCHFNSTEFVIPEDYDHHHAQASWEGFFQGDIKLEEDTTVHGNTRGYNTSTTRNLNSKNLRKWDDYNVNGYYRMRVYIDPEYGSKQSDIQKALRLIQYTGKSMKFQFLSSPPSGNTKSYVHVKKAGGCWSYYGRTSNAASGQILSLSDDCLSTRIIHHVFLHCLGFCHEVNRSDRNKYITVKYDNILPEKTSEFAIIDDLDSLGLPFDYKSAMMYSPNTFAKNSWQNTIVSNTNQEIQINSKGCSWWDFMQLRLMYQCRKSNGSALTRDFSAYRAQKCSSTCKCWRKSAGCKIGGDSWCSGNLVCRQNVCR